MIRVLSLGAGVQSTTVLLLSAHGELPKIDCAVFADTGWEPRRVYEHLEWLEEQTDIPIHRVSAGNIKEDALVSQVRGRRSEGNRWASMPYYTLQANGDRGMIRRQCSREYKADPVDSFIRRELLGLAKGERAPLHAVEQWFGISTDEMRRVRVSRQRFAVYRYPLVHDLGMSRTDCLDWMKAHGYPNPPRSACIGCPYHSEAEWLALREEGGKEWEDACATDEALRDMRDMRGQVFLHRSCEPLRTAPIKDDRNQGLLFPEDEHVCDGMCGL